MPDLILGGIRWITFLTICSNFRPASISGGLTANTPCSFGRMASAQFFSGPTPFCRRDTRKPYAPCRGAARTQWIALVAEAQAIIEAWIMAAAANTPREWRLG